MSKKEEDIGGFRSTRTVNADGIQIDITHRVVTPSILWDDKYKMHQELTKGIESRNKMSEQLYAAVVERLKNGLGYLWENVEDIAPNGLDISENGQMLDIHFHLILADLEQEANRQREENTRKSIEMAAVAKELMEGS
jgi:hypothetical protein